MITRLSLLVLFALLVGIAPLSYAQTVDAALVDTIAAAFQQTLAVTSLHVDSQSMTTLEGGAQGMGGAQQANASTDLVLGQAGWNLNSTRTTLAQFGDMQIESTVQMILLEGVTYANLDGIGQMGQMMQQGNGQALPQGWFEVTADAESDNPLTMLVGDTTTLSSEALGALQFPIDTNSISAITELPADTIDGQAMRVYQVTLNAQSIIDSLGGEIVSPAGMGGGFGGGQGGMPQGMMAQGTFTPPGDGQFTPPADGAMPTIDPANVQINVAVYIGEQDGLVHRIYSVIATASTIDETTQVTTSTTSITDFTAFNTPIEITAPTLGA